MSPSKVGKKRKMWERKGVKGRIGCEKERKDVGVERKV
jgi:hypothetical protein